MIEGEILVRVVSDYFCASIVVVEGKCVEAAPILRKHLLGRSADEIRAICARRRWRATICNAEVKPAALAGRL